MGRNLHPSIPSYLEDALEKHTKVSSWQRIDHPKNDNEFIYLIKRNSGLSELIVHATDEYAYSLTDYFQRPTQVLQLAFILIARPEADYDLSVVDIAKEDKNGIGKFGALMGALYKKDPWDYVPRERKE